MLGTLAAALVLGGQAGVYKPTGPQIEVSTNRGKFVITTDPKGYPKTVKRIQELVKAKFYDGQRFHRVEPWVVQWGDPVSRTSIDMAGRTGSGKQMPFEGGVTPFVRGVVGIASTGSQVGGDSQMFVLTKDAEHLYNNYAVLGKVTKGLEVVDKLERGDKITSMRVLTVKKK